MWRIALVVAVVGCGASARPGITSVNPPPPPPADLDVAAPHGPPPPAAFPEDWGGFCTTEAEWPLQGTYGVELVACDVGEPPPDVDDQVRPRSFEAHLLLRRIDIRASSVDLGGYVKWEEGAHFEMPGVLVAGDRGAAVVENFHGSMGPDSGGVDIEVYAIDDHEQWRRVYSEAAEQLTVEIHGDELAIASCDGTCDSDPDNSTRQAQTLHWDGQVLR